METNELSGVPKTLSTTKKKKKSRRGTAMMRRNEGRRRKITTVVHANASDARSGCFELAAVVDGEKLK